MIKKPQKTIVFITCIFTEYENRNNQWDQVTMSFLITSPEYTDCIPAKGSDSPNECDGAQSAGAAEYTDCIFAEESDPHNKCPRNDTNQSDGEAPVMRELWGEGNTPSLPSFSGPTAPDSVLFICQIELNCVITLNWIVWN